MRDTSRRVSRGLIQRVNAFSKVRVLVVGDLVADHYVYGQTERVSREAPVLIVRHEREEVKLGGAANAAANARSLGAQVTALGVLGRDSMGQRLGTLFRSLGITLAATTDAQLPTETKTRVLAGGLSTTRQQMLRIDRGSQGLLPPRIRLKLATRLRAALARCDVAVISDYGAGVIGDETRAVLREFAQQGGRVCADSRYGLAALQGMSVCKPNEPELAAFTGLPTGTDAQLTSAARAALSRLDCQTLLVTRGRRGMAVFERAGAPTFLPVHGRAEAVDVTGAGDTVIASFALALGAGATAADAARLANIAGSLVVQKPGTATVTREELLGELK
ncbi:MAG: D-beta-D-heptose 7-phosphate kinase [Myxococcaceae bacterium]|nr:D-beta-D-heptose 7-phosphate kinase [Myxococcaceae bacterium]